MGTIFYYLEGTENLLWEYLGVPILIGLGIYLSIHSRFFQIRQFPVICRTFFGFFKKQDQASGGVHPLKAFFACVGGCVGVGNIVGICTAVQVGGPGALFWIWITAIVGTILKYSEVYLGMRHRVPDGRGGYRGGPMYFLQKVPGGAWLSTLVCFFLCIYGVEIYQFSVITNTFSSNFHVPLPLTVGVLAALVAFAGSGGVKRVGGISSAVIPVFIVLYAGMGFWVLLQNIQSVPAVLQEVFSSAFSGSSVKGGFIGSTIMLTISQGVRRGCYTGDVGVGYASVIHSESSSTSPEKQASLVIVDVFVDTFIICTTSLMLILTTDIWHLPMDAGVLVQEALGSYFPYMHVFMPLFLFLLGYSTINAYFCVGLNCAAYLSPRYGKPLFYLYALPALIAFSFIDSTVAQSLMSIAGGGLLLINCYGIYKLRGEVSFDVHDAKERFTLSHVSAESSAPTT